MDPTRTIPFPEGRDDSQGVRCYLADLAVLVILLTGWLVTLGPLPAILALVTAKHILVALLMVGLNRRSRQESEATSPGSILDY